MSNYFKVGITLLISFSAVFLFSLFLEKGEQKYHVHKYNRVQEIFEGKENYDVLYIGSSRTHTTIFPRIIDSISHWTSYNGGVEGGNLYEFSINLKGFLFSHPAPKICVITLDPWSFDLKRRMFYPVQYFQSLSNPALEDAFKKNPDYNFFILRYLPFLRTVYYNDYAKSLAMKGLLGQNELLADKAFEHKGFLSNGYSGLDLSAMEPYKIQQLKIDPEAVDILQDILHICKEKNIFVVFTYAPEYKFMLQNSFTNFQDFITEMNAISQRSNIPFYREDSLSLCSQPELFANYGHVNVYGAFAYSKILGKRILKIKAQINERNHPGRR